MAENNPFLPQKFHKPIVIAEVTYTHFKLREPTVGDMFTAELEAGRQGGGAHTPLLFNGHMMVLQMVCVCDEHETKAFSGPFTLGMLKNWGPKNYGVIRENQMEIDLLGEADSSDSSLG